ncbi:hypothetical protein CIK05_11865 [Bdellovibrio sp. qaytius]|nr:hypothetical protein CIK05_11865 [Bdellovibrio sp. qaytius]
MIKIILLAWTSMAMIGQSTSQPDVFEIQDRAMLQAKQGKYIQALQTIEKAIEIDPKIAEFYVTQSHVFDKLRRYPEAMTSIKKALRLEPTHRAALVNKMIFASRMNDASEYVKSYQVFIKHHKLKPDESIYKEVYNGIIKKGE